MSERQILEMGIRAMGVVLFFRALDGSVYFIVPAAAQSGTNLILLAFTVARIVVAFAMVRYAPRIASRVAETSIAETALPSTRRRAWNRWLLYSASAFAVAAIGIRSVFNTAKTVVFQVGFDGELRGELAFSTVPLTMEILLLFAIFYAVIRRPEWIVGKQADDV